eukprot:TRINITY_DN75348_c0_g1_i1.p1 TRINITY_DN75348_c0_g1~~TRINITY_DN75348_c0_g1_i1.p1  ORF type:complete len:637 (+),score=52.59 TRINITY_DN75348_c0_g1_i1:56-1966(+)
MLRYSTVFRSNTHRIGTLIPSPTHTLTTTSTTSTPVRHPPTTSSCTHICPSLYSLAPFLRRRGIRSFVSSDKLAKFRTAVRTHSKEMSEAQATTLAASEVLQSSKLDLNTGTSTSTSNTTTQVGTTDEQPQQYTYPVPPAPWREPLPPVEDILDGRYNWRILGGAFTLLLWLGLYWFYLRDSILSGLVSKEETMKPVDNTQEGNDTKFADVLGCDDAKNELLDIVNFLKNPKSFSGMGAELPKGLWMEGDPGVGKTMLGKAVANEAGVPFFYTTGSSFDEIFVGLGAKRVRKLFTEARSHAPCVVFIDEMDAVGGTRTKMNGNRQTINQLLSEMDGFNASEGIVVIGATNLGERLDKALVRPGRFDRHIRVDTPDKKGRAEILRHYLNKLASVDNDVDAEVIAASTPGLSGADLSTIVNYAAIRAIKENADSVSGRHIDLAKDEVLLGHENKSKIITEKDRKITACHEGGHALVALLTQQSHLVNKATILSRGHSLGQTHFFAEERNQTKQQIIDKTAVALGGRAAEEIINGRDDVTTGASSDIEYATRIVRGAVMQVGFGKQLGVRYTSPTEASEQLKQKCDEEVHKIVGEAHVRAKKLLKDNESKLRLLSDELLKKETLTANEMRQLLDLELPK